VTAERGKMGQPSDDEDVGRRDFFDLVHGFVTASREGELTESEIADFEQLLADNPEARRLYAEYLEATLALPSVLVDGGASGTSSPQPASSAPPQSLR
jgi:hypothetical protein